MKYINFVELWQETDWPLYMTKEQRQQLLQEKIRRVEIYNILHPLELPSNIDNKEKPCSTQP